MHVKGDIFLCLGDKREVEQADPIRLARIVIEAVAFSAYNDIQSGRDMALH